MFDHLNNLVRHDPKMTNFFLASFPRSGNTFCRLLLNHHFGINTIPTYGSDRDLACSLTESIMWGNKSKYAAWKTHWNGDIQGSNGEHKLDHWPALVLARDGRDACVSFAHYKKEFWDSELTFEQGLQDAIKHKWTLFYDYWMNHRPGPCYLIRYEDLKVTGFGTLVLALDELLGLKAPSIVNHKPLPDFRFYNKQNAGFFRKGQVGSWKEEMPKEYEEAFWKKHGPMMKELGYER